MAHLRLVLGAIVRQHVDDEDAAARLQHARRLGQRPRRIRQVVQHQRQHRDVELAVVDRQRFERAAADVDVGDVGKPGPRRLQHVG